MNKDLFKNMGAGSQLFFLFFLTIGGLFIAACSITLVIPTLKNANVDEVILAKVAQFLQVIMLWVLPAITFAYLFNDNPKQYLRINIAPKVQLILFTLLIIIVAQPFLQLISYYNSLMTLPEGMHSIETWMKETEQAANNLIRLFLQDKSPLSITSNIFIMAIMAGVAEELIFRGCLQQTLAKILKNSHLAVWFAAIIFSAIHFQFYGFFTRLLAGVLLGYLFVLSRNLWLPIIAHTMHNLINIILTTYYINTPLESQMENLGIENHLWLGILSFFILLLFFFIIYKKRVFLLSLNQK